MSKISKDISIAVKQIKRKNNRASVRYISEQISKKLGIKVSKSSVSAILKKSGLSSPRGRRVSGQSLIRVTSPWAGYFLFWGADALLGLSGAVAACFRRSCPSIRLSDRNLQDLVGAWLLAKVIYSVNLTKIEDYEKDEIWQILGRRISKGSLTRFLYIFNSLELVKNEIVTEINHLVQDVHYLKFDLEDKTSFFIDGTFKTIWDGPKIPINFCSTYCNVNSYVETTLLKGEPVAIFNARPESALSELLAEFIFALDGSSPRKRIRNIRCMSSKGLEIKEVTHSVPPKINFIIGVWPWQYKAIAQLEKKKATGYYFNEAFEQKYPCVEETIRFAQHLENKEVILRLVVIKESDIGHARIALFTNMDEHEFPASEVVKKFVRRFPFFEDSHKDFLEVLKTPAYVEEYPDEKKILAQAQAVQSSHDVDEVFTALVDILNSFMQRSFFPSACWGWSMMKMRELFLKQAGRIRRDYVDDSLCNLLVSNRLRNLSELSVAALRFNEMPIFDADGKKMWVRIDSNGGPVAASGKPVATKEGPVSTRGPA